MQSSTCFLCAPDPELIVARDVSVFAMVGYGPLTPTYCLLASTLHFPSLADLFSGDPVAIKTLSSLRTKLERSRGSLLMTEHGRVSVCRNDDDEHDQHCFHGHALLFKSPKNIDVEAGVYYRKKRSFCTLESALAHAASTENYFLVSPSETDYVILSDPLNAPRQLARTLVAFASDTPQLADWRSTPRVPEAVAHASTLRAELKSPP